uniref:SH2 domain-containing protein n=1 Tax=Cavia porcellus TaxID=10141 RepID=A0A286XHT5_CAVPO
FNNCVYTYRIFKVKHGYYNIQNTEGTRKMIFPTLKELVSKFEKPDQGLVFHLSKPINRPSLGLRHRTSQLASENLYENGDYVELLP